MFRFDSGIIAQHQITQDGYLRTYMRIAKADHELVYRNPLGSTRVEVCPASELFRQDSLDSFMMLPITNEHPPVQVDSRNYREYGRGSSGQTLIREVTPVGTFLGTIATIHDGELVDAIVKGEIPGVSPGYRVKTRDRADGKLEQYDRRGNHIAAVRNPRGGADVKTVLEGLRVDSEDEPDLWVQDSDSGIYRADVGDWILPLLTGERHVQGLVERKPIVLDKADSGMAEELMDEGCDSCKSGDCDCESCAAKRSSKSKRKKKSMRKDDNLDLGERMDTATINVNGIDLEMPVSHAAIIQQALTARTDSSDEAESLRQDNEELQSRIAELESDNQELRSTVERFIELAEEAEDEVEDDEFEEDSADDDDALSFDSIESLTEFVADSIDHYLTLSEDAELVGLHFEGDRKDAISTCLLETEVVQRQILEAANPGFKTDSYEGEVLSAVYEVAMKPIREKASDARGSGRVDDRADSAISFVQPLKALGSLASTSGGNAKKGIDSYYEQIDAAFIGNK